MLQRVMVGVFVIEGIWLFALGGFWQAGMLTAMVTLELYSMHLDRVIERLRKRLGE